MLLMFCLSLREKAVFAISVVNNNQELIGHASFCDYPNLSHVSQSTWEQWLVQHYRVEQCMVRQACCF